MADIILPDIDFKSKEKQIQKKHKISINPNTVNTDNRPKIKKQKLRHKQLRQQTNTKRYKNSLSFPYLTDFEALLIKDNNDTLINILSKLQQHISKGDDIIFGINEVTKTLEKQYKYNNKLQNYLSYVFIAYKDTPLLLLFHIPLLIALINNYNSNTSNKIKLFVLNINSKDLAKTLNLHNIHTLTTFAIFANSPLANNINSLDIFYKDIHKYIPNWINSALKLYNNNNTDINYTKPLIANTPPIHVYSKKLDSKYSDDNNCNNNANNITQ